MAILLKNGLIYPMENGAEPFVGDILVNEGKVVCLGKSITVDADQIINCQNSVILPGLIDAHCHIGLFGTAMGERGIDGNEDSNPCTPELLAIDAINPYDDEFEHSYRHGVTTVSTGPGSGNPIGGQFVTLKTCGRALEDRILQQPSAMKMAFGENPKTTHEGGAPLTRMATAAIIREALVKAKRYGDDKERAIAEGKPFPAVDVKSEALLPVLRGELPVKAHAHRADDILTALRIAKEFGLRMSIEHASEGHLIADMLGEAIGVIIGPLLGFPHKLEVKNQTAAAGKIFFDNQVPFAIMSDLPASHTCSIIMAACECVREGLDTLAALRAITFSAAEILGIEDRVGSIAPGKDADLVIFSAHPLEVVNSRCVLTMIDGKIVHDSTQDSSINHSYIQINAF